MWLRPTAKVELLPLLFTAALRPCPNTPANTSWKWLCAVKKTAPPS